MDKYIAIKTGEPSFYQIYIFDRQVDYDTYKYLLYNKEAHKIYKSREAAEKQIRHLETLDRLEKENG